MENWMVRQTARSPYERSATKPLGRLQKTHHKEEGYEAVHPFFCCYSGRERNKCEELFNELWELYPRKMGKASVSKKAKQEIFTNEVDETGAYYRVK